VKLIILGVCGAIAAITFVTMLLSIARHRAQRSMPPAGGALAEYVWATVPWLMVSACVTPAVRLVIAAH
jgi:heme/copper-type cytochrome/quinol oxidase subunit 2